jgi:glycosyltransferase involved in cell wall biosynthesis
MGYCGPGVEHEALSLAACGVPVVCPATDAGAEYVRDAQTGLLFTPGNSSELAECLRRLASDAPLRARLGAQARQWAEGQSWDRTAGLVLATIENLHPPADEEVRPVVSEPEVFPLREPRSTQSDPNIK